MTAMTHSDLPQHVYLIRWGPYIKVGCSVDPLDRLGRVTERGRRPPRQQGAPELLGSVPGGMGAESWLHAALAGHHAVGEWFHDRGPVTDLVDFVTRTAGLPDRPDRAALAVPAGDAVRLHAAVTGRGPNPPEQQLQHAVAEDATGQLSRALCGVAVTTLLGPWDRTPKPGQRTLCVACRRLEDQAA